MHKNEYVEGFVRLLKKVADYHHRNENLLTQYWESLAFTEFVNPKDPETYENIVNQRPFYKESYFWTLNQIQTNFEDYLHTLKDFESQLKDKRQLDEALARFYNYPDPGFIENLDQNYLDWKAKKGDRLKFNIDFEEFNGFQMNSDIRVEMQLELVSAKFKIQRPWFQKEILDLRMSEIIRSDVQSFFKQENGGLFMIPEELIIGWRPEFSITLHYPEKRKSESKVIIKPAALDLAKPVLLAVSSQLHKL